MKFGGRGLGFSIADIVDYQIHDSNLYIVLNVEERTGRHCRLSDTLRNSERNAHCFRRMHAINRCL